jgi:ABC-type lipoprotein release transport system permease subunit
MTTFKMLLAEIAYRKLNFALSLLAVTTAVALFVAGPVLVEGYRQETKSQLDRLDDETRQNMRDMGFNLMIVHLDNDMSNFWASDFAEKTMPQEYVERLANDRRLTKVNHLVATLQQKIDWQNQKVLLVGYLPETPQPHRALTAFAKRREPQRKKELPMGEDIAPGTVHLGHQLAAGKKEGQTVEVLGRPFRIAKIDAEHGSKEDITIKMDLADAQQLLGKPGQINQILALECECQVGDLPIIREQLEAVLPEAKVTEYESIAVGRAKQREAVKVSRETQQARMQLLAYLTTSLVVLASGLWVGLLALANVRERLTEIGILRALGKGSRTIMGLFLGKAVLVGLLGAGIGFLLGSGVGYGLGTEITRWFGAEPLYDARGSFAFPLPLLLMAVLGAPLLSAVASYLPALWAALQDPAVVLRDQ